MKHDQVLGEAWKNTLNMLVRKACNEFEQFCETLYGLLLDQCEMKDLQNI